MQYLIKRASHSEIAAHLLQCDEYFVPRLSERLDIQEYALKLFEKSTTFEAWDNDRLVGLVAVYLSQDGVKGFVSNVSVCNDYGGRGVAATLVNMSIDFVKDKGYTELGLEVDTRNNRAISVYKRLNFVTSRTEGTTSFMKLTLKSNLKPHEQGLQ